MMKKIYILFVILFVACMLSADNNHAAAYMKMGTDAKAMGMGGAVAASIDNVNAAYWNPANLTFIKTLELATTMNDMGMDRNLNYFAIGNKFDFGVLALSWMNASVSDLEGYDSEDMFTGNFDTGENNIAISYANCWYGVKTGLNLKYYLSDIDDDSESAFGIDLGFNYYLEKYKVNLALMLRDLYSAELAGEAVPMQYSLGVAWKPYNSVTLESDFRSEIDGEFEYALGAEYWNWIMPVYEKDNFFNDTQGGLRLGLNNGNFAAGFGIKIRWIEFNYAYINEDFDDIFDDTHQFSLVIRPYDKVTRPEPEPVIVYTEPDTVIAEPEVTEEEVTIVMVSGTLIDEMGNPVSAEIAWKESGADEYTDFVMADMNGYYEIYLDKNTTYEYMIDAVDHFIEKSIIDVGEEDIENFDIMLSMLDFSRYVINFEFDSAVIKEESYPILDDVAAVLVNYPSTKIEISGHTDNRGGFTYNKMLSYNRALAVSEYLANNNVDADQLYPVGYGYNYPLYSNDTEDGRIANRRIEIKILESGDVHIGPLGCVAFESGKYEINEYSKACLDMLADQLIANDAVRVEIGGYTDNVGNEKANVVISQKRAQAVVDYLISKGVKAYNLEAKGYGEAMPIAPNDTSEGREKNRRIEVRILSVESLESGVLDNIFFEPGKADLNPDSFPSLNKLAAQMAADNEMNIEVCGYTDNTGSDAINMEISQKRAEAVVDYLAKAGIQKDRMVAAGYGPANPIADNSTPEGRAKNRRIEIRIIDKSAPPKVKPEKPQKPKPKKPAKPKTLLLKEGVLNCVGFASGSSKINEGSKACLDRLAKEIIQNNANIQISAFTDNVGSDDNNLKLSQRRAKSVVDYLVSKGVKPETISSVGYGEKTPIADNATKEGRAKNRRIELKFVKEQAPKKALKQEVLKNIFFASGKAELSHESYPSLNKLAAEMIANAKMKIEVCGYTDNVGDELNNIELSQKRAEAVVNYLIAAGISEDRLLASGFGAANPVADNSTMEGRAKNRRIEIRVLDQ